MWIKRQVVMLPTEKAEKCLMLRHSRLSYQPNYLTQEWLKYNNATSHHLYILSDDEPKEGDWYYQKINGLVEQVAQLTKSDIDTGLYLKYKDSIKKIITTTDSSLKIAGNDYDPRSKTGREWIFLPQPSQSFIEKYIEEYNKGNIITEVMVEYGYTIDKSLGHFHQQRNYFLKVNPKDNTITIRKIKDSWNREEVIELFLQCNRDLRLLRMQDIQIWIDKNL